ncbi:MAG: plasmid pRiA4b ORF-3 family protein [Flavobacteriaceae bacterium]|nr:plasmid pRiA4b ORF-3 family protein [Flavobacteriaceae bacterium]
MIYRFRIILDAKEDVFRDIEIDSENTLEEFHNAITQAFGFEGQEMASFYQSNEKWEQGEEIALFDMSEEMDSIRIMNETPIDDITYREQPRMIYVYDFLSMWTFFVELADTAEADPNQTYPNLMFAHGEIPDEAPEKEFKAEGDDENEEENFDEFDHENYDDLDFEENWN